MPVPVPKTRSSAPPSESIAAIKKRQLSSICSVVSDNHVTPPTMNGHTNGSANGNGATHRRRRSRKRLSETSSSGDELETKAKKANGTVDTAIPPPPHEMEILFDEWTGIMKRIVNEWEIPRKVLHSSIGFGTVYLYSLRPDSSRPVITALAGALAIIVPCDILRLRSRRFERVYERLVGFLMRESERHTTNGVIWYIIGVIYVLTVLPRDLAVMAILILSWCDTAASTIGRMYGKRTPPLPRSFLGLPLAPRKSLAGSLSAVLTGAAIAVGMWGWAVPLWQGYAGSNAESWGIVAWKWEDAPGVAAFSGSWPSLLIMGLGTGLIAGITEALDLGRIDDNLSLPIISGTVLWGVSKLVGLVTAFLS